jgi:sugar (pentulose or hexulose) kinase
VDDVPVVVAGTTAPAQRAVRTLGDPASDYPRIASRHALADRFALESNAGPTAGVLARLAGLEAVPAGAVADELARRGFAVDETAEDAELTVLSGNPTFSPAGWSAYAPPTVIGLRPEHGGAEVMAAGRAGACYAIRSILTVLDAAPGGGRHLRATGGMTTNAGWCQLLADVCGRDVVVRPLEQISGLAGAALVTGDEALLDAKAVPETTFRADANHHARHELGFTTYLSGYERSRDDRERPRTTADARTA